MNMRVARRITLFAVVVVGIVGLSIGGWVLWLQTTGNVHAVEPNALYRSAQLNGDELQTVLTRYGIKSVINLRGDNVGDAWYEDELTVTRGHGAAHFDVGIGATSEPTPEVVAKLLRLLRTAPRPILVHCSSGSDRTGLAAALYERFVSGASAENAAKQLSFRFGHFPWLGSRTVAMDRTFWKLATEPGGEPR